MGAQWYLQADAPAEAAEAVRAGVRDELAALGVGEVPEAELMAWELITNALRHTTGKVAVLVSRHDRRVRVEVVDGSTDHVHQRTFDPERIGGHGVELVDAYSTEWGETSLGSGKAVWFDVECATEG